MAPPDTVWTTLRGRSLAATAVGSFDADAAIAATLSDVTAALAPGGEIPLGLYAQQGEVITPLARLRSHPGAVRVFRAWATPDGHYLAGPDVGIDLVDGAPTAPAPGHGDIDAVFTWVDGSDPAWQERQRRRLVGLGREPLHETAANEARYASFDELRYALRAVGRYAPWVRSIHLVTDRQRPAWLAGEFPHVEVVDHRDIFAEVADLPTFNSHAIESRLHHIPGIAERYLYLNDDFFLGRYLPVSAFFTDDGRPRVFLAPEKIEPTPRGGADAPVETAAKNNRELLQNLTGYRLGHKLKHAPYAMTRSLADELEARAPRAFRQTAASPFRAPSDFSVTSSLLPHYGLATGQAVASDMAHFYADVTSPELRWRLPRLLEHRDADIICLNATTDAPTDTLPIRRFLERYFPA
jgi:hypothetical protein